MTYGQINDISKQQVAFPHFDSMGGSNHNCITRDMGQSTAEILSRKICKQGLQLIKLTNVSYAASAILLEQKNLHVFVIIHSLSLDNVLNSDVTVVRMDNMRTLATSIESGDSCLSCTNYFCR